MKPFSFELLSEPDLQLMYDWFQESTIKASYARGQVFSLKDIKDKYLPRILGKDNIPSYIIKDNRRPIGFIQYYLLTEHLPEGIKSYTNPLFHQYPADDIAGIDCFIAHAENRGKGLGSQLIHKFIADFLVRFRAVIVDPDIQNQQAIRCYEKIRGSGVLLHIQSLLKGVF